MKAAVQDLNNILNKNPKPAPSRKLPVTFESSGLSFYTISIRLVLYETLKMTNMFDMKCDQFL